MLCVDDGWLVPVLELYKVEGDELYEDTEDHLAEQRSEDFAADEICGGAFAAEKEK